MAVLKISVKSAVQEEEIPVWESVKEALLRS